LRTFFADFLNLNIYNGSILSPIQKFLNSLDTIMEENEEKKVRKKYRHAGISDGLFFVFLK